MVVILTSIVVMVVGIPGYILTYARIPKDPITLSDDEQGVYSHLRNERYLGSMKPFSEGEPGSLGNTCKNTKDLRILGICFEAPDNVIRKVWCFHRKCQDQGSH